MKHRVSLSHPPLVSEPARRLTRALSGLGLVTGLMTTGCPSVDERSAPEPCGSDTSGCGTDEHCDRVAAPPRCVCDAPYTGAACDDCAPGYAAQSGRCVAEPVSCLDGDCGGGGECVSGRDGDNACLCDEAYAGVRCATCADGFQDHDSNGTCAPACGVAELSCTGRRICSDASGTALCICTNGYAGPTCSECIEGYRKLATEPSCVPTCASPDVNCSEHSECVEGASGAFCRCLPGWSGDTCSGCDLDHHENSNGDCVASPPAETLFLTAITSLDRPLLAALAPPSFEPFVLTPLAEPVYGLAFDAGSRTLYASTADGLATVSFGEGSVTPLLTDGTLARSAIAFDSEGGALASAGADGIFTVEVASRTVAPLSPIPARAITFTNGEILALEWASGAAPPVRLSIDPTDGSATADGRLTDERELTNASLAFDATTGLQYLLGLAPESPTEALVRHCRALAEAFGLDAASSVPFGAYGDTPAAGAPWVLEAAGEDPPLVVYGTVGEAGAATTTLRVATEHPDAVLCVVTDGEPLRIEIPASVQFRLLVVDSAAGSVELEVAPELATGSTTTIQVHAGGGATGMPPGLGSVHDAASWGALGVPAFSTSASAGRVALLGVIDWASGAVHYRSLPGPLPVGALTPYAGQ